MNANGQQPNQFLNYQNYHHDQLMHHQYFDENPHVQNYNFIPYSEPASQPYAGPSAQTVEQVPHQETFPSIQSNDLYEFLPEEIFQLDQPILKTEAQHYNSTTVTVSTVSNLETFPQPFTSLNNDVSSTSHCFLDLSSGQIQTNNAKYSTVVDSFSSEINNNSSYHSNVGVDSSHVHLKAQDVNSYNYQINHEASSRLTCAVESEKLLKRKHIDIEPVVKQNPPTLHQNYHLNQPPLFTKRENTCLIQQTTSYYPPELYSAFSSKPNDVYRTMDKYNNYITNN